MSDEEKKESNQLTPSINTSNFTAMMSNFHSRQLGEGNLGKKDVNMVGSESIWAQKCFRDKKWCHISRRQSSNSMKYGWMSVSGVAVIQSRKSSREIPANKHIFLVEGKMRSESNYTWGHIKHLQGLPWFGEYRQDTSPVLHLALQLIPPLGNT